MKEQLAHLTNPVFSGRWLCAPIYAFSGVFLLDGKNLTPDRIRGDVDSLYREVLAHRTKHWPLVLSQFFLVPVYCSPDFCGETFHTLLLGGRMGRRDPTRCRIGLLMKPMLYSSSESKVVFREALQNWNMNYYPLLKPLY